jgi:hypothetical protein
MDTIKVKLYEVITYHEPTDWESSNLVGIVEGGWDERLIDTHTDRRVFYFAEQDEFDELKIGDDLSGDGDIIKHINRTPDYIAEEVV